MRRHLGDSDAYPHLRAGSLSSVFLTYESPGAPVKYVGFQAPALWDLTDSGVQPGRWVLHKFPGDSYYPRMKNSTLDQTCSYFVGT